MVSEQQAGRELMVRNWSFTYFEGLDNQIQVYHDATAFWLDREWKTPKQRQLEKEVERLRRENNALKQENGALKGETKVLRERLEPLKVFENIPCSRCRKPLTGWTREEVLRAFRNWHHSNCYWW
jgi:FtsZ-binding cell division protein ZapB